MKPLAVLAAAGMWIVLIMGATVTNTGSQTGCGPSWPLCRGRFIPQFAVSTFIEFSHRTVVGIETIFILAFAIAAWQLYRNRVDMRLLIPVMVAFLFLQAGLGAWAVMSPQNPAVLALHFGVSLIAFASVLLAALLVFELDAPMDQARDRLPPKGLGPAVWGVTIFSYVVVYLGAYVRHIDADRACSGWPLCNGRVIPGFHGTVGTAFAHRAAALVLTLGVLGLLAWTARIRQDRPDLFRAAAIAVLLVVVQALSGALVVFTKLDLFSALAHAGVVALLFGDLSYLCLHVMPRPVRVGSELHVGRATQPART
ncbi:MAG TPA: heme A synthase [Chloroflexota bacterium]|nr:heme A synthase [Chloroflexota bacterium]